MGESADTVCGFGRRNLLEDFADVVYEIEFGRPATILAFLVSLRAAPLCNGFECQTALGRRGPSWKLVGPSTRRQISTLSFQRSRTGHLKHGSKENTPDSEIKDPFVLEFLGLKDEYSESELEEALIRELEQFLLELGNDFAFIARQKRLRVGTEWYRVDLLFFHRRLRSLIVVELLCGRPHNNSVAHRVMWRSTSQAARVA